MYICRLLVGAPREKVLVSGKIVGGAIYKCNALTTSEQDCTRLESEPFSKYLFSTQASTVPGKYCFLVVFFWFCFVFFKGLTVMSPALGTVFQLSSVQSLDQLGHSRRE